MIYYFDNRVHGSTILENLKQEVERSDEEVRNMHAEMKAEAVVDSESMDNGELSLEQMLEAAATARPIPGLLFS